MSLAPSSLGCRYPPSPREYILDRRILRLLQVSFDHLESISLRQPVRKPTCIGSGLFSWPLLTVNKEIVLLAVRISCIGFE